MALKYSGDIDELCYPFIYEQSYLCDYDVATDELCSHVGNMLSVLNEGFEDISADLNILQPMIYHLNGSIRGKLAISETDLTWLKDRYHDYQRQTKDIIDGFVLPRGNHQTMPFQLARSAAKKAIRMMVRIDQEGREVPDVLHRFCNLLCNFFFVLALTVNARNGFEEVAFVSRSYSVKCKS